MLVDISVYHNGFHGDLNETLFVGKVDEGSKKLVKITHECLQEAIKIGLKTGLSCHCNANNLNTLKFFKQVNVSLFVPLQLNLVFATGRLVT